MAVKLYQNIWNLNLRNTRFSWVELIAKYNLLKIKLNLYDLDHCENRGKRMRGKEKKRKKD